MAQPAAGHHARDHHLDHRVTITSAPGRLPYIDWLRGVAILIMIGAHTFDAWTLPAERLRPWYGRIVVIAGMAAPLFLFLAGVGLALSAAGRLRKGQTNREASWVVQRSGLAGVWVCVPVPPPVVRARRLCLSIQPPEGGHPERDGAGDRSSCGSLGRGPLQAGQGHLAFGPRDRHCAGDAAPQRIRHPRRFAGPARVVLPAVGRAGHIHDLPWSAFVFAGAVLGTAIDGSTERLRPVWLQAAVAGAGAALFAGGVWSALRPMLFPGAYFWTTSPAYVAVRVGLMLAMVPLAWLWTSAPGTAPTRRARWRRSAPGRCSFTGCTWSWSTDSRAGHSGIIDAGAVSRGVACHGRGDVSRYCWAGTRLGPGAADSEPCFKDNKINSLDAKSRTRALIETVPDFSSLSMAVEIPRACRYNAAPLELAASATPALVVLSGPLHRHDQRCGHPDAAVRGQFYQASLTAKDIDKLVRFEVLVTRTRPTRRCAAGARNRPENQLGPARAPDCLERPRLPAPYHPPQDRRARRSTTSSAVRRAICPRFPAL